MANSSKEKLLKLVGSLLTEYGRIQFTNSGIYGVSPDSVQAAKFNAGCQNLLRLLAEPGIAFKAGLDPGSGYDYDLKRMLGTLQAISEAIQNDLLLSIEEFVRAELFDDLLEQADHLLSNNYFLAAGVLGRAVLEEHLRKWCDKIPLSIAKPKPTLSDFVQELYKANLLNKIELKHVEALAAIGNEAAHNLPTLKREDVERLLRDVREFITKNPI